MLRRSYEVNSRAGMSCAVAADKQSRILAEAFRANRASGVAYQPTAAELARDPECSSAAYTDADRLSGTLLRKRSQEFHLLCSIFSLTDDSHHEVLSEYSGLIRPRGRARLNGVSMKRVLVTGGAG